MQKENGQQPASIFMPNLSVPEPPADLAYGALEDYRHREILKANGQALSEDALLATLNSQSTILAAAAAHTLGALSARAAIPALESLLKSNDDLVKVEAAYALARLAVPAGKEVLQQCLSEPIDANISPPLAAGYLAQLGDAQGFPVIENCLASEFSAIRMIACKQFYFFLPFQETHDPSSGRLIDVFALYQRALHDSESDVQWQALVQLRDVHNRELQPILTDYIQHAADEQLRAFAERLLRS